MTISQQALGPNARVLKAARHDAPAAQDPTIAKRVSSMLLDLESRGMDAVRHYSAELDRWSPPTFRATAEELRAAAEALPPAVREKLDLRPPASTRCSPARTRPTGDRGARPTGDRGARPTGDRRGRAAARGDSGVLGRGQGLGRLRRGLPGR